MDRRQQLTLNCGLVHKLLSQKKMKLLILSLCLTAALADVSHIVGDDKNAPIIAQELDMGVEGDYKYSYETGNKIVASERGSLQQVGPDQVAEKVEGQASWLSPEGEAVSFSYVADENGYQPQGSHIPTPHPIPDAIVRALKYIQENPPPPEN